MRLVDSDYKPLAADHRFNLGDKIIISDDVWCCYNLGKVSAVEADKVTLDVDDAPKAFIVGEADGIDTPTWVIAP